MYDVCISTGTHVSLFLCGSQKTACWNESLFPHAGPVDRTEVLSLSSNQSPVPAEPSLQSWSTFLGNETHRHEWALN